MMTCKKLSTSLIVKHGNMNEKLLIFLLFGFCKIGYCQTTNYSNFKGVNVKVQLTNRIEAPYFKQYGNPFKKEYIKMTAFNRFNFSDTPEEILFNVYTSSSDNQLKRSFAKNTKIDLTSFKQTSNLSDSLKDFLVLRHKLTFNLNDQELAIIKYTQYKDSVALGDYSIQVLGNKKIWQGVKLKEFSEIEFAVLSITADEFWSFHKKGKLDENDKYIAPEILEKVKDEDGVLNLSKLASFIRERKK